MSESKFLWISDIHYSKEFESKIDLKEYIKSFIESTHWKGCEYLIISGDISGSGVLDDFDQFGVEFKTVLDYFNGKILFVPGNHDVYRRIAKYNIENKYNQIITAKDRIELYDIVDDITSSKNKEDSMFYQFNDFYKDKYYSDLIHINKNTGEHYKVLVDKEKKLAFFLINSSFFSLSKPINDLTRDNNTIFDSNHVFSEYGNQVYLCEQIRLGLDKIKSDFPDYIHIGIAHHPPSWVHWTELYSKEAGNDSPLQEVLKDIGILFVGHEHVHPMPGEFIYGTTLLLKGSRFMNHSLNNLDIKNNGYKIVTINGDIIYEEAFIYNGTSKKAFERKTYYKYNINKLRDGVETLNKDVITIPVSIIDEEYQLINPTDGQVIQFYQEMFSKNYVVESSTQEWVFLSWGEEKRLVIKDHHFLMSSDNLNVNKDLITLINRLKSNKSKTYSFIISLIEKVDVIRVRNKDRFLNELYLKNEQTIDIFRQRLFDTFARHNMLDMLNISITYNIIN